MAKKNKEPEPRNLASELGQLGGYASQFGGMAAATAGEANRAFIGDALGAVDTIAGRLDNEYTRQARGQLNAVGTQLGELGLLANRQGRLAGLAEQDVQGTEIERLLQQQALEELQLGRMLSPEQERQASQVARGGLAQRGMATGLGALAQEILSRDAAAGARQDARRGFASGVNQMQTGNRLQRLGQAGSLLGQTAGTRQNTAQLGLGLASGYVAADPYQRALASNIPVAGIGASAQLAGNSLGQVMGYGQDLFNTNYNADWSRFYNQQNLDLARQYGGMGAAPGMNMGGMALGAAGGALSGAAMGAAMGSVVPGIGTAAGALAGGAMGLSSGMQLGGSL